MKYSYEDEYLMQNFTFFLDTCEDSFTVSVYGTPADLALFDMMLRSNGLIFADIGNKGGNK